VENPQRVLGAIADAIAAPEGHDHPVYGDHMSGSDWGLMVLWTVLAIAVVVAVIWAVLGLARREPPRERARSDRSGREILDERLARGEIGPDEYDRLREWLDRPTTPGNATHA
jgi:putative membrane protein